MLKTILIKRFIKKNSLIRKNESIIKFFLIIIKLFVYESLVYKSQRRYLSIFWISNSQILRIWILNNFILVNTA